MQSCTKVRGVTKAGANKISKLEAITQINLAKYFSPALDEMDAVFCAGPNLDLIYINAAAEDLFGITSIESLGSQATSLMPKRYANPFAQTVDELLNKGRSNGRETIDIHGLDSSGVEFSMSVSICTLALEDEVAIIAMVQRTESGAKQRTFAQKEKAYHKLIENLPLSILIIGPELNLAATNRPTMAFYGIADRRCVTQVSFADLVAADDQQRAIADLDEVFKTGQSKDVDYQMVSATGDDKHVKFSLSGILSEGGNAHEIMAIAHEPDASDLAGDRPINLLWFERVIADTAHIVQSIIKTEDPFIADHQERVAKLAAALAEDLGLPKEEIEGVYVAANFHDIGKFFVPTQILSKPEKLTHKERQVMQRHVNPGHNILSYIKFRWPVATAVSQHHERLDGSGYPAGLKGDDISLEARILAVADVMEAMASDRPYREGLGVDAALIEISQGSGVLYDSIVAESCARLFKEKDFQF